MRFVFLLPIVVMLLTLLSAKSTDLEQLNSLPCDQSLCLETPKRSISLLNEESFVVVYAFEEKKLESFLKKVMVAKLEKLGAVHCADDSKLTDKQKEEKYKIGGGLIHIIVTPIIEETGPFISDYKFLPVLELSLKVIRGVELLSNATKFACPIWENNKFISMDKAEKKIKQRTVASLELIIDAFIADYQQANPGKKPEFFLYH